MSDANTNIHLKPSGASMADSEKTAAVSKEPSIADYEKTTDRAPSEPQTAPGTANSKEPAVVDESDEVAEEDPEHEYPKAWRLGVITIALCLSVFCMALVRITRLRPCIPIPCMLTRTLGQHHHRDGYPPHHGSVQGPE